MLNMIVTLINISEDTYSFLIENAALLKRADVCVCLADTKNGGFNQSIERAKEKLLNYHREGDDNRYPFRCFVNNDGDMAWRLASKEESLRSKTIDYLKASLLFKLCSEGITSFHLKMDDVMKRSLHVCKSFAQVYEKALYTTMTSSLVCMKVFPLYKNGKILLIDGYVVLGDILTEKLSHIRTFFDAANFLGPTVIPNDMDYKDVHMVYDAGVYYDEQLSKYNISNEDNNPLYNLLYKEAFSPQEFHRFGIDDVSSFFSSIEELCQEKRSEGYIDRFMEKKTAVGGLKDIARVRGNFGSYENWLILEAVLRYVLDAWESFPLFRSRFFCLRRLRKLIYRSYTSNSFKEDDFMSKGMLTDFQSEMHFQSNILDSYDLDSVESFFKENVDGYVNSWLLLYDLPLSLKEAVDFVCKQDIEDKETVFHILQGRALEFLKRNSAIDLVKFAKNNKLLMRPAITFNISKEEISFESLEIKFCILSTLERLIFDEYRNSLPAECLRVAFISSIGEINLNNLQRKVASLFVKVGSENREKVEEMKKCVDSWVSTYLPIYEITNLCIKVPWKSKLMPQGQKNSCNSIKYRNIRSYNIQNRQNKNIDSYKIQRNIKPLLELKT